MASAHIDTTGNVFVDHRKVGHLPHPGSKGSSIFRADDKRFAHLNGVEVWRNPRPERDVMSESDLLKALEQDN